MTENSLDIKVFGSGCPSCRRLHEHAVQAVKDLGLDVPVEYVTDVQRLIDLGVMQSPVMTLNGRPVVVGYVPESEEIMRIIREESGRA